ncbi:MAG: heme o synthase [Chloroherpetonaceae bacterium]|nr:heme o synthase [Chloroherpetonaceae bacterium]MCS7210527.1 heme o synthase [Chloroherpetonaceae bacterium]MDW8019637.1 heme o synthase [Chloroherpetonaceae bacterium]MDW8467166.1 heme o synthase [Chloroherpetonaceae bacterium]
MEVKQAISSEHAGKHTVAEVVKNLLLLTKPTIMLLVVFSAAVALCLEGSLLTDPLRFGLILLAVYLTGGAANALNQYFEREIDAQMARTRLRRPLPQGKLTPNQALGFSVAIAAIGVGIFAAAFNWLSATITLATILFYGFFYTLWLKPTTPQNIVIGGAAGAMAPIGVWAAVTGNVALEAYLLFLLVFFWTPPHFWALAMLCKEDYQKVNYPMMPIAKGDEVTLRQMVIYTTMTVAVSLGLAVLIGGYVYWIVASVLGGLYIKKTFDAQKNRGREKMRALFSYSILYLFGLFTALVIESVVQRVFA